jgi:hypothetical protein
VLHALQTVAAMKYLAAPELTALTNCVAGRVVGDVVYDGHAEAYSCEARAALRRVRASWAR